MTKAELEKKLAKVTRERDLLLGIFSDYEMPCRTVKQARGIWNSTMHEFHEHRLAANLRKYRPKG